jgi:hypothetical protein
LDRRGQILKRLSGEPTGNAVEELCNAIGRALDGRTETLSTH